MTQTHSAVPELPDFITFLAEYFRHNIIFDFLLRWQFVVYAALTIAILVALAYLATRKTSIIPNRIQNFTELIVGGIDDFLCGILGQEGRHFVPFIGTLFVYILFMNVMGLIPFMKSATSSWSTTLALGLCVFGYVQYTGVRKLGFLGYLDHLAGKPRGILAFSIVLPVMMVGLHILSELIRPISLSLRLRSNIWGDDLLLAVLTSFGLKGLPLLLLNTFAVLLAGIVQAVVFSLLSTIYFALILVEE
ncbi:MAG: F0F1 ATP synthase subunit A [Candidatus Omnitrophota bacterium]